MAHERSEVINNVDSKADNLYLDDVKPWNNLKQL